MDSNKLKFEKLETEERKILLSALNIPLKNMQCYYCADKVDYRTCGIMPPLKRGELGRITCSSPLCICEYLEDYEKSKPQASELSSDAESDSKEEYFKFDKADEEEDNHP